ncbi:MAG: hypothetical protein RLZZ338_2387 [Cyanobacteriota bacterium]
MYNFAAFNIGFVLLLILVFGILQWLHIAAGNFLDWVIAIAIFEWLLLIVTVPWNIHFEAKQVLAEAEESRKKSITVDQKQIQYVMMLASRSLVIAIALHLISAIGFYTLAVTGISSLGYITSAAALLLTFLRPAIRLYQYLSLRLSMIRQEFFYPRQDTMELRSRMETLEFQVQSLTDKFNSDNPNSWVSNQEQQWQVTKTTLTRLAASIEDFKSTNDAEHQKLARDSVNAIAQLTTDSQVLNNVREIIRFFKEA